MMTCYDCGKDISESAKVCPGCGAVQVIGDEKASFKEQRTSLALWLYKRGEKAKAAKAADGFAAESQELRSIIAADRLSVARDQEIPDGTAQAAVDELKFCAEAGCALAHWELYLHYVSKVPLTMDRMVQGNHHLLLAVVYGHVEASVSLANRVMNDGAVALAYRLYDHAAKAGSEEAIYNLALATLYGRGVKRNEEAAQKVAERLDRTGDYWRLWDSLMLFRSIGKGEAVTTIAPQLFKELRELLVLKSTPELYYEYATAVLDGYVPDVKPAVGIRYLRVAANHAMPEALRRLASEYDSGENVKKDAKKAMKLHHEAAELGDSRSLVYLAELTLAGVKTPYTKADLHRLYLRAAEYGEIGGTHGLVNLQNRTLRPDM